LLPGAFHELAQLQPGGRDEFAGAKRFSSADLALADLRQDAVEIRGAIRLVVTDSAVQWISHGKLSVQKRNRAAG